MKTKKNKEIPFSLPYIDEKEIAEVVKVLRSKWITTGSEVQQFETRVKQYLGVTDAVAVSSGTAALEVSLAQHGVAGGQVLTTAYTFVSTALAILRGGGEPVFVDVEPDTFNIAPEKIEEKILTDYCLTERGLESKKNKKLLRGLVTVHFGGQPAEMEAINKMAGKYNLFVVEDAAHAMGASHRGVKIGKSFNLVCFSFYSNKNMTTGEGGMIVTNTPGAEAKLRMYSLHGISKSNLERYQTGLPFYDVVYPGFKANLSDIHAALGVVQIQKLDKITRLRREIAGWYDQYLSDIPEISLPVIREYNDSARHLYPILVDSRLKAFRDEIIIRLREKGVFPSVHFIPVHFLTFFKNYLTEPPHLPVTEDLFYREISLPIFPELKKKDVKYVAETLKSIIFQLGLG